MDQFLSVCLGLGLAAACGFRVFVPLLMMSIAVKSGMLNLAFGFEWLGSTPALIVFGVATALEIGAYYIPWLDNLLDSIASPAAVVAGVIVTASAVTDMNPVLKWSLALVAGGGIAGLTQGMTGLTRSASTLTTGGLANPLVSTAEAAGSVVLSALAIVVAPLALLLVIALVVFVGRKTLFRRRMPLAEPGGG